MKNGPLSLFIFLFGCSLITREAATEPKAEILGIGSIRAQADYISLTFNVRSECFETPLQAQKATDEAVAEIYQYLQTLKTTADKYFKVLINGGFTNSFSKHYQNKEICLNTFQKRTEIVLNIATSGDFSALFTQIQSRVLRHHKGLARKAQDEAQTFVTLSAPEPRLEPSNRIKLERKARSRALLDAKANFKATVKSCEKQPFNVVNIREGKRYNVPQPLNRLYQSNAGSPDEQAAEVAPLRFDDLIITKEVLVTFQVEGILCFESARCDRKK